MVTEMMESIRMTMILAGKCDVLPRRPSRQWLVFIFQCEVDLICILIVFMFEIKLLRLDRSSSGAFAVDDEDLWSCPYPASS